MSNLLKGKLKRVTSMMIAIFMLFTLLPTNIVYAIPNPLQIEVNNGVNIEATVGQTVDVEILIPYNPGISGMTLTIGFDEDVIQPIASAYFSPGVIFPAAQTFAVHAVPGQIVITATYPVPGYTDTPGLLITLHFDVVGDVDDESPIDFLIVTATYHQNGNPLNIANGGIVAPASGLVRIVGAGVGLPPDLRIIPDPVIVPTRMVGYQSQIPGVGLVNNRGGGAPISAVILALEEGRDADVFELFPDFLPVLDFIINDLNVDLFDGDLDAIMNNIADAVLDGLQNALEDALQGETLPTFAELELLVPPIPANPTSQDLVDFVTVLLDNVATFVDDNAWIPGATVDFVQIVTDGVMGILAGIPEWNEWWNDEFVILPMWPGGYFPFAVRADLGLPVGIYWADLRAVDVMDFMDFVFDIMPTSLAGFAPAELNAMLETLGIDFVIRTGNIVETFQDLNTLAGILSPIIQFALQINTATPQDIIAFIPTMIDIVDVRHIASQIDNYATAEVRFRVIEKTYKVTFVTDGTGNGTLTPAEPVVVRVPATAPNNHVVDTQVPTVTPNAGYTFHWTSNRHSGQFTTAELLELDITKKNTVFTAVFVPIQQQTWTVTFNSTTGSAVASQVVADGGFATQPPNPTRANHTFAGWYTALTGGTQFNFAITQITSDITLFARWTPTNGTGTGPGPGGGATPPVYITPPEVPLAPFVPDHIWYVRGFPDGSFRPGQSITRAEVAMILWRLLDSDAKYAQRANNFSDVSTGWYARAVSYLAFRDIVTGYPDGTFRPNNPITRAELTAMMSRFFDMDETAANNFTDVSATHWAIAYINNAHNKGWIEGDGDGTFRPSDATTRAEAVTIINRVLDRIPNPQTINYHLENSLYDVIGVTVLFNDITSTHWAFFQIMEAAIEHEFDRDDQGREVWSQIEIPWWDLVNPAL